MNASLQLFLPNWVRARGISILAGAATIWWLPLVDTRGMGRETEIFWPEPQVVGDVDPAGGPVVVKTTYTVSAERDAAFLEAMSHVRRSRLRTGAMRWGLFRDAETANAFVELFVVYGGQRRREHAQPLVEQGLRWCDTAREVAEAAEFVFMSLPYGSRDLAALFQYSSEWPCRPG